jgi:hypothetical protein
MDRPFSALFFGGSFTFGEGLNDKETLPFFFSAVAPEYESYNYGFSGYGPQQMCELLRDSSFLHQIVQRKGVLVYVFVDDHVRRAIGSLVTFNGWCRKCPNFVLQENGSVKREGNFSSGRPVTSVLYRLLGISNILRVSHFELPPVITADHMELAEALIAESRRRFLSLFPSSTFITLIYPGSTLAPRLKPLLEKNKIAYLDYSSMTDLRQGPYVINAEDKHASARANSVIAQRLYADIKGARYLPVVHHM